MIHVDVAEAAFLYLNNWIAEGRFKHENKFFFGEFDPGSG